jgi:DNA-binding NarL/FixJ family response regulator
MLSFRTRCTDSVERKDIGIHACSEALGRAAGCGSTSPMSPPYGDFGGPQDPIMATSPCQYIPQRRNSGPQREVLALLGCGMNSQQLAISLGISKRAVKAHISALLDKFKADT